MDLGCGITFDIFTHVSYTGRFKIYYNIHTKKERQVDDIQVDDLDEGYNVELKRIVKVTRSLWTLSL